MPILVVAVRYRDRWVLTWAGMIPAATYLGLLVVNQIRFGMLDPFAGAGGRFTWPFSGLLDGGVEPVTRVYAAWIDPGW